MPLLLEAPWTPPSTPPPCKLLVAEGTRSLPLPSASRSSPPQGRGTPSQGSTSWQGSCGSRDRTPRANMTQRQAATSCSSHRSSGVTSASARAGRQDMPCMPAALLPDTAWPRARRGLCPSPATTYLQIEFHTCTLRNKAQVLEKPPSSPSPHLPSRSPHPAAERRDNGWRLWRSSWAKPRQAQAASAHGGAAALGATSGRGEPWAPGARATHVCCWHDTASKTAHLQLNEIKAHPRVTGFPRNPIGFPRNSGNAQIWYVLQ